jgi:hypothetical protein
MDLVVSRNEIAIPVENRSPLDGHEISWIVSIMGSLVLYSFIYMIIWFSSSDLVFTVLSYEIIVFWCWEHFFVVHYIGYFINYSLVTIGSNISPGYFLCILIFFNQLELFLIIGWFSYKWDLTLYCCMNFAYCINKSSFVIYCYYDH